MEREFLLKQKDLLWIANSTAGRHLINTDRDEPIVCVFPSAIRYKLGQHKKKIHYISQMYPANNIGERLMLLLNTLELAREYMGLENPYEGLLHYSGLEVTKYTRAKYPTILHADTFNPDAGGRGRVYASDATFATARAASSGTVDADETIGTDLTGGSYFIYRVFLPIDTAALPDNDEIVEGANTFMRFAGGGSKQDNNSESLCLVNSTQASNTALAAGDFDQLGTTEYATRLTFTAFNTAANNDMQLNGTGIGAIVKNGFTKFGARGSLDLDNSAPAGRNFVATTAASNLLSVEHVDLSGDTGGVFIVS